MRKTRHPTSLESSVENTVRQQYERFPYPPIPVLALPKRNQGRELRFERGCQLEEQPSAQMRTHSGIRILVAGAGTIEPLVVAQMHPHAHEIIAIDLSQNSLNQLKLKLSLARWIRFPKKRPPIKLVQADLLEWLAQKECPSFDYIVASNVIHHVPHPQFLLALLSKNLAPGGLLRLVTYPKASRIWMRLTAQWLRIHGLTPATPHLISKARETISLLPEDHPICSTFFTHPEIGTAAGVVDAFLHSCENPLKPLEWEMAAEENLLQLIGETQTQTSKSDFLNEIVPELSHLSRWNKLQILDDLLELCANPILWFKKLHHRPPGTEKKSLLRRLEPRPFLSPFECDGESDAKFAIPPLPFGELREGLLRIEKILENEPITLDQLMERFKTEVGPRVNPHNPEHILKGLALSDYSLETLLNATAP